MKISVAQSRPVAGDIEANILHHLEMIRLSINHGADAILFPELSITGYEPTMARALATSQNDRRFDVFQQISDENDITIGIGAPVVANEGVAIGMFLFQPNQERKTFLKRFLHHSEEPFFVPGESYNAFQVKDVTIALAICYEISVPEHAENAFANGAQVYLASVVEDGVDKAIGKLSDIARKFGCPAIMANCTGQTGQYLCPGKSSAWDSSGALVGQLSQEEGILTFDIVKLTVRATMRPAKVMEG